MCSLAEAEILDKFQNSLVTIIVDELHHYDQDATLLALNLSKGGSIAEIVAEGRDEVLVYDNKDGSLKIYGASKDIKAYIEDLYQYIDDIKDSAESIQFPNLGKPFHRSIHDLLMRIQLLTMQMYRR